MKCYGLFLEKLRMFNPFVLYVFMEKQDNYQYSLVENSAKSGAV